MTACGIIIAIKGNPKMSTLGKDMQRSLESGVCACACVCVHVCFHFPIEALQSPFVHMCHVCVHELCVCVRIHTYEFCDVCVCVCVRVFMCALCSLLLLPVSFINFSLQ